MTGLYKEFFIPILSDEENLELLTRAYVRDDVEKLLEDQFPLTTLHELRDILYTTVYMTYRKLEGEYMLHSGAQ
jgi:hypothetical protein